MHNNGTMGCILLLTAVFMGMAPARGAAAEYPAKTIQFIVNKGPGGGSDTVTRMYAAALEKVMGAKTVVVNKPGGDGVVGTNDVAKAAPDGYTLFVGEATEIAYGIVNGSGVKFSPESFVFIAGLNVRGSILGVRKGAPFEDFKGLVEYAKANPRKVTIGTPGGNQIAMVKDMMRAIGAELTVINAGNGNQLFTQVAGGHIDVAFIGAQFHDKFIDEGCNVVAQTVASRDDGVAVVPTVKELGYDFEFDVRMMIGGPAGLPDNVVEALKKATGEMYASGVLPEMLSKAGEKPKYVPYDELNRRLKVIFAEIMPQLRAEKQARK